MDSTLMEKLWEQFINQTELVTLPAVYLRLKAVMDEPDFDMASVSAVISQDPAMTARLLRQVNSAYFGFTAKIDTVSRAVAMLGAQPVHDVVLAASISETFTGVSTAVVDMQSYWRRSVYCAIAARSLAAHCNLSESERLFLTGLLRDIGHLVMFQSIPDVTQHAMTQARQQGRPIHVVEREQIGFDYGVAGGALLRQWQLPQSLWEPVEMHVSPEESGDYQVETCIVQLAAVLAEFMESDADTDADTQLDALVSRVYPGTWEVIGIKPEQLGTIREEADQQIDEIMNLFFPHQVAGRAESSLKKRAW